MAAAIAQINARINHTNAFNLLKTSLNISHIVHISYKPHSESWSNVIMVICHVTSASTALISSCACVELSNVFLDQPQQRHLVTSTLKKIPGQTKHFRQTPLKEEPQLVNADLPPPLWVQNPNVLCLHPQSRTFLLINNSFPRTWSSSGGLSPSCGSQCNHTSGTSHASPHLVGEHVSARTGGLFKRATL